MLNFLNAALTTLWEEQIIRADTKVSVLVFRYDKIQLGAKEFLFSFRVLIVHLLNKPCPIKTAPKGPGAIPVGEYAALV